MDEEANSVCDTYRVCQTHAYTQEDYTAERRRSDYCLRQREGRGNPLLAWEPSKFIEEQRTCSEEYTVSVLFQDSTGKLWILLPNKKTAFSPYQSHTLITNRTNESTSQPLTESYCTPLTYLSNHHLNQSINESRQLHSHLAVTSYYNHIINIITSHHITSSHHITI